MLTSSKICSRCRVDKPLNDYYLRGGRGKRSKEIVPHCKPCSTKICAVYNKAHPEKRHRYYKKSFLKTKYGLSLDEYKKLCDKQDGKCAICSLSSQLVVDHCHSTGKVRGLLCQSCNTGIGFLKDSANITINATQYLQKHGA